MPDAPDSSPWLLTSEAPPPINVTCWIWGPSLADALAATLYDRSRHWVCQPFGVIDAEITHYQPIPRPEPPTT